MAKDKNKNKVKIDDQEYDLDKLSDDAKSQLVNLQFIVQKLQQLSNELAVAILQELATLMP